MTFKLILLLSLVSIEFKPHYANVGQLAEASRGFLGI